MERKISERAIRIIKGLFIHKNDTIVVSGLGRSGTSMLYSALVVNHCYKHTTKFLTNFRENNQFDKGSAYKTHDFPPSTLPDGVKVLYLFGNPMNIAISTHQRYNEWGVIHHNHLHTEPYQSNDDIFYKDILQLEIHFDTWYKPQRFPFITIKYENLYDKKTIESINDFLGFKIKLPPKKIRKSNWENHKLKEPLYETYSSLLKKIQQADNVKIWK